MANTVIACNTTRCNPQLHRLNNACIARGNSHMPSTADKHRHRPRWHRFDNIARSHARTHCEHCEEKWVLGYEAMRGSMQANAVSHRARATAPMGATMGGDALKQRYNTKQQRLWQYSLLNRVRSHRSGR